MSLHRITAGSGYDYLTRQVAAMDSTEKGHTALSSYYSEKGEAPGQWMGSGLVGIDGLEAGDVVTAEQMLALFGAGHHPLANQRVLAAGNAQLGEKEYAALIRLGKPYPVYEPDVSDFRIEVARRLESLNKERGLPRSAKVAIDDRARVRTEVGLEMFAQQYGRAPLNPRELSGHIAKLSRQQTTAVAGFDLTFSPVKSVSTLWALADPQLAARIEMAHNRAVADALSWIETQALYTRMGAGGIRQVEVKGLVAAAFTHRDSRAGDPDLHTHVAVANKVQTAEGQWLAIDGRVIYKATVAASETYNTALERHLSESLGVEFADRASPDPRKRSVREIVGVDPALNERWSSRRAAIEVHRRGLAAQFQADHGRPPTPQEAIALAQQANLETRDAKHEPRSLAEQRVAWRQQAISALGSEARIRRMIDAALHPTKSAAPVINARWIAETAGTVVERVQQDRSVWQMWHIHAEALRFARSAQVPGNLLRQVVDHVVDSALHTHSVALGRPQDGVREPHVLRRSDGASVYDVAGSQLFTSSAILAAEQRLVAAAGLTNGMVVPATAVDLALLESEANGVTLNAGQVLLVREMASSGARVQLAIAPAGSGKTTAMNALSRAWIGSGGNVVGLAPSAVAAAALGEQMEGHTNTLASLTWVGANLDSWRSRINRWTLVVIDEAGMADTLSLDKAVTFILEQGGSVRFIGDDQQLAAIGAGGVLRDIQATHGALRLTELLRFSDRAEGSASLALRQGQNESLGFYLDRGRIHVGDETTMADDLFAAWSADRDGGSDSIMLAPTRGLVAELNQRARTERLNGQQPDRCVDLPDGNQASAGDTIITRSNRRDFRLSATDFVKNGDRFTVEKVHRNGSIAARHIQTRRRIALPADYVAKEVELGYACTTHTAQGVTADTMHGLLSGDESRQQAYTMLTRGRHANHAYVVVVGDGDPHTTIRSETINPLTPTDVLERILARDESPVSATTSLREAADPRHRLGSASARYDDAIVFAAEHEAGEVGMRALERAVDQALPRITDAPNWPALRSQLILAQANGRDPIDELAAACSQPIASAHEPASVLAWRVADSNWRPNAGPLPWLRSVPSTLAAHPTWGPYLSARANLVASLADHVRADTLNSERLPAWVGGITGRPTRDLVADVEVWRAATSVIASDLRPTGDHHGGMAAHRWQQHLDTRLASSQSAALAEWGPFLDRLAPTMLSDDFAPTLAHRLSQLSSSGINAAQMATRAAEEGPLPDDHTAAALWWRLARHLTPAVAEAADTDHHVSAEWIDRFSQRCGEETSRDLQSSTWWPALVSTIERGLQRGWPLDTLLDDATHVEPDGHADLCQTWVWRLSLLTDIVEPTMSEEEWPADELPPEDLDQLLAEGMPHAHAIDMVAIEPGKASAPTDAPPMEDADAFDIDDPSEDQMLAMEAIVRRTLPIPEATDADVRRQMDRRDQIADSPVHPDRLGEVNQIASDFYEQCLETSWAQSYLADRLHIDPAQLATVHAGYAPDGWTGLVNHLRRNGVDDTEMLTAGLAMTASTGRLIDRFRDRAVFPIVHEGTVLGFVARRNPAAGDEDNRGPKYLNTAETPIFHKGDQLYVAGDPAKAETVSLVEGPMDAIATTLASRGRHVGVAALGTSLTEQQVAQLHSTGKPVVSATDADLAGRVAAERDYWLLAPYNIDAGHAALPEGSDPADLVESGRSDLLVAAIDNARPLAEALIDERLDHISDPVEAALAAVRVLAAQPPEQWTAGAEHIAQRTGLPSGIIRSALAPSVRSWNNNSRKASEQAAASVGQVKARLAAIRAEQAAKAHPEQVSAERQDGTAQPPAPATPAPTRDQGIGR
jgi:DNA primase catalytic core